MAIRGRRRVMKAAILRAVGSPISIEQVELAIIRKSAPTYRYAHVGVVGRLAK